MMTWICHVGYFVFTLKEVIIVTMGMTIMSKFTHRITIMVKECDLSFSWKQRVSSIKNRHWKTSWSNGSEGILASKV
nr:hypothetical protein Iba_scaffold40253CG0010 [Ipomoea batatas]